MTEILAADGLTSVVDGRTVLADVTVRLVAGESGALFGPSGSGKSVLLTTLSGLVPPQAGTVRFMDEPVDFESERRRRIALILQTYGLFPLLTAAENVEVALRVAGWRPDEAREAAEEELDRLGLGRFVGHLVEELSGGQEQRVAVARATAVRPRVLLADEPTTEQDKDHRDLVLGRLFELTAAGTALLLATHDDEVAARCDRVLELRHGRLAGHAAGDGM